jgi:hypothetical protein
METSIEHFLNADWLSVVPQWRGEEGRVKKGEGEGGP